MTLSIALASVAFFRYSRSGTAILAVSQEPVAAQTVGISVSRISLITWTLAGLLGVDRPIGAHPRQQRADG